MWPCRPWAGTLRTSISTIQWVPTIYLLAFASVIPLTGWTAGRFGAKRVWLASLGLFMAGSLLAGLSPSIGALISVDQVSPRSYLRGLAASSGGSCVGQAVLHRHYLVGVTRIVDSACSASLRCACSMGK